MKLEIVTGVPFTATCIRCGNKQVAGGVPFTGANPVFADLDGKAFVDYYCNECAEIVRSGR